MKMYMPNPFKTVKDISGDIFQPSKDSKMIENGYSALRFLLRDLKLTKNSKKVAIPSFVCNSVCNSVIDEGWEIVHLDLKNDSSFWSNYDFDIIKNVDAVIIVHLYGLFHPNTTEIEEFCIKNNIPFIHDCAQASFLNDRKISSDHGILYSFNVGKYFTASGGAIVEKKNLTEFKSSLSLTIIHNIKCYFMVRSRMFNSNRLFRDLYSFICFIEGKLRNTFMDKSQFLAPTNYQLKIISSSIKIVLENKDIRIKNFRKISSIIAENSKFKLLNNFPGDAPYKVVFIVLDDPDYFESKISKENIHFFRLFKTKNRAKGMNFFNEISHKIFEISCELSISTSNINTICRVLNSY